MVDWNKEVKILGLSLPLKYWVLGFIFLTIGILGFVMAIIYTPLEVDIISVGIGVMGVMLTALTWSLGATKKDINTVIAELKKLRETIVKENNRSRQVLEEILRAIKGLSGK